MIFRNYCSSVKTVQIGNYDLSVQFGYEMDTSHITSLNEPEATLNSAQLEF